MSSIIIFYLKKDVDYKISYDNLLCGPAIMDRLKLDLLEKNKEISPEKQVQIWNLRNKHSYKMKKLDQDLFEMIKNNNFNPMPETKEYEKYYNFLDELRCENSKTDQFFNATSNTFNLIDSDGYYAFMYDDNFIAANITVEANGIGTGGVFFGKSNEIKRICLNIEERKKETDEKFTLNKQNNLTTIAIENNKKSNNRIFWLILVGTVLNISYNNKNLFEMLIDNLGLIIASLFVLGYIFKSTQKDEHLY